MDSDQGKLFVGGISWETTEEKLIEYFSQYGEVLQTVVMFDKITRRPRGFGFVVFSDPSVLDRVLQDKHTVDGRTVEVKRALSREEQQTNARLGNPNTDGGSSGSGSIRTKKIFVGGLPASLSEDGFREYFETYGNVTDVVIMYDQNTQRPRGFGFISFDSEEAVDRVLHKTFHDLNGKKVEVKRALPKDANPGGGGRGMGGGGYQAYGGSGGNSGNVHDGRMDSSRYMQAQNVGSGFGPYGNSGYGAPSYGYGPTNSGMGYGGYGGYAGPTAAAYGNPSIASSGYAGGPQGGLRGSWGSQAASGYGAMGYGAVASWGGAAGSVGGAAGPGSAPMGHSPSAMGGYGSQGYGYGGGYGGGDGSYGNQAGYGARFGGGPSGGAGGSSGGDMQGNGGYGGYNDDQGNTGYGNAAWRSDQSQVNGPQSAQGGYGSGYGGTQSRQGQQH